MVVKSKKDKVSKSSDGDSKVFALLAILLSIVGFLIAYFTKKDDKYVMYYAKQSLVLFVCWIILWFVGMVLYLIPIIGR